MQVSDSYEKSLSYNQNQNNIRRNLQRGNSQNFWANVNTLGAEPRVKTLRKRGKIQRISHITTLAKPGDHLDKNEQEWIRKFNSKLDKKSKRQKRSSRESLVPKEKNNLHSQKVFLEDNIKEKKQNILEEEHSRRSSRIKWKDPIYSERIISTSENNHNKGIFSRVMGFFCVYLPRKVCPNDSLNK